MSDVSDPATNGETPPDGSADQIKPFMVEAAGVRGRLVQLGDAVEEVLSRHPYPQPVAALLAEMLALTAALGSLLKFEGVFTLQTKGDGPISMMVADMTADGALRGYADYKAEAFEGEREREDLGQLLGKGYIAFTVDQGPNTERYQGIVELRGARLHDSVQYYFRQSEQLSTALSAAAGQNEAGQWRAGAIILQQMPEEEARAQGLEQAKQREEGWVHALTLMSTTKDEELLSTDLAPNELLYRLYHEDGVRVFPARGLGFGCRCSRERVEGVLRSIPDEELATLKLDDGRVEVVCEFCRTAYHFDDVDLAAVKAKGQTKN